VNKNKIVLSSGFKKSLSRISSSLTKPQSIKFAKAIDNLKQILRSFPECYPVIQFEKHCEIPFRKAVIAKNYIVIYLYQYEKIYFIELFHTAQNWQQKLLN